MGVPDINLFLNQPSFASSLTSPYFKTQRNANTPALRPIHRVGPNFDVYTSQERAAYSRFLVCF